MIRIKHQILPSNIDSSKLHSKLGGNAIFNNRNALVFISAYWEDGRKDTKASYPLGTAFGSNPRYSYGVEFINGTWSIIYNNRVPFSIDGGDDYELDAVRFHVIAFENKYNYVFEHTALSSNVYGYSTYLSLNYNNPRDILIVTQKANGFNINPREIAVQFDYIMNRWKIINVDGSDMKVGLKFNVLIANKLPSRIKHVFYHTLSNENRLTTFINYSKIEKPFLNSNPNLSFITTQQVGCNQPNNHITCIWYDTKEDGYNYENNRWFLYNTENSSTPIVLDSMYNILVLP